jgi:hypothetical protein
VHGPNHSTQAARQGGLSGIASHQSRHLAPKLPAPIVHVTIRPSDDLGIGLESETVQDDGRRLRHRYLSFDHGLIDVSPRLGLVLG